MLFTNLDLTIAPGDVVGVVGANGAGKSTLLKLLAGIDRPLSGRVLTTPRDAFVGWLPQEHERKIDETVAGYISRRTGSTSATMSLEAASEALAAGSPGADERFVAAMDHWMACGAADLEERLPLVLADVAKGIPPEALMTDLSGGQLARVALGSLLLSRFDLVLLDEPTNDLDVEGLDRLEKFIHSLRSGVVLVSHDREFLARSVTSVVELDLAQNKVAVYQGGYDNFLEEREIARRHARESFDEFDAKKSDLVSRARTQREWSAQGVRNSVKKSPDNDKIRRKANKESSENQAQKARQMQKQIARLDVVDEPRKEWQLKFTIGSAPRSSMVVATLNKAVIRKENFTLGPVSLQVNAGQRIGITGPNGSGKSTLLRLILGHQRPDAGSASMGSNVSVGEIDQARIQLPENKSLLEAFISVTPGYSESETRPLLAKFGLGANHINSSVNTLSPGERTRASLALLQARGVNLLVLDEPTNHLDLPAIEQLEQALEDYEGTLLLVTHDRRLMQNVRLDEHWQLNDGKIL